MGYFYLKKYCTLLHHIRNNMEERGTLDFKVKQINFRYVSKFQKVKVPKIDLKGQNDVMKLPLASHFT